MSNVSVINATYDIGGFMNLDPISDGPNWLGAFNASLDGWFSLSLLIVVGLVLFLSSRTLDGISDTAALMYSSFIISVVGVFLLLIDLSSGYELLGFAQWSIIFTLFLVSLALHKMNLTY